MHALKEIKRLGQEIKTKRENLGLTQENLAEKVGCSTETIRFIENANRDPSIGTLVIIAKKLGVKLYIE